MRLLKLMTASLKIEIRLSVLRTCLEPETREPVFWIPAFPETSRDPVGTGPSGRGAGMTIGSQLENRLAQICVF